MNRIEFVDTTLRDAHQSLWGCKMSTAMMYEILPSIEKAGYKAIDAAAPTHFVFFVRTFRENPWERMNILHKIIKSAPLSLMMLASTFTTFKPMRGPIINLWMKRCYANGIKRIQPMDASNNMSDIKESVKYAKDAGMEVIVPLIFSESPVHTDEYYAEKARDAVAMEPHGIYLKDPGGLLTPERIHTLIPKIQENIGNLPLELHSHCTTGLAPLCYLKAIKMGVKTLHTASRPLSNSSSQPSIENVLMNSRHLGYSDDMDDEAIQAIAEHFTYVAKKEQLPIGTPPEYDLMQYEHQIPGGVISNLKRQLTEIRQETRLNEVIREAIEVRKDLGYPIMVTPFSQYVATQATLNVMLGERYKEVIDEIVKMAMGYYGPQAGAIDSELLDRIERTPQAKEYANYEIPKPSIHELRKEYGPDVSEDELLLRILCQEPKDIEAMHAAGRINTYYPRYEKNIKALLQDIITKKNLTNIYLKTADFSIKVTK